MFRGFAGHVRLFVALATFLTLSFPSGPALAQSTSGTNIWIDSPVANATLTNGVQTDIGGWAVNPSGPGTGVDVVRVYLDNTAENSAAMVGTAELGVSRPDVASTLKNSAYAYAGYNLLWTPSNVSSGTHTLYVYAHAASGWTYKTVSVSVQAGAMAPAPDRAYGGGDYRGDYRDYPYYRADQPMMGGYYNGSYRADAPVGPGYYGWNGGYMGYNGGYLGYNGGYYNYPGYYGGIYPPYQQYPYYPTYPTYPGQACIMIYPPPPGC